MPPKNTNVEKLLQAEERRNRSVAEAKARKAARVKQAKADAEKDVTLFRQEKESEFEQFRAQQLGGADVENSAVVRETEEQIQQMKIISAKRMEKVAAMMAELVTKIVY
jgi:V-type H+-transporting ATPase subunit G